MSGVRARLSPEDYPHPAPEDTLGGETLRVSRVWERLLPEGITAPAPQLTFRGEAILVRVWAWLQAAVSAPQSWGHTFRGEALCLC